MWHALAASAPLQSGPLRPRVLMTTEGTYPYVMGGVSSWCELLVGEIDEVRWQILPIVAGDRYRTPMFDLPEHAELAASIDLWSATPPPRRAGHRRCRSKRPELPAELVEGLISWDGDVGALVDALVWCRRHPEDIRPAFRSREGWAGFTKALRDVLEASPEGAGPSPELDALEAARLYQSTYWLARTAARPTPMTDVLLVTAAGWAAVPALVHRAIHRTPLLLVEHGVYVREAYLKASEGHNPAGRFLSTRLARSLARAAYETADVVSPVTDSHAHWERALGVDPGKIRVIHNGVLVPDQVTRPPGRATVITVGRIDPLKDVMTLLRVAAEVLGRVPEARFLHYGPVPDDGRAYAAACRGLHAELGLGDRFRFMGSTSDPHWVVRDADVFLMTSVSEGFPLSILEAMAEGRPVVATAVGGVADAVKGCGILVPSGDVYGLALATCTLLRNPGLARALGLRGYVRLRRRFTREACVDGFRALLAELGASPGRIRKAA